MASLGTSSLWGKLAGVWCSGKELRCAWGWFGTPEPGSLGALPAQPLPPAASAVSPFEAAAGLEFSRAPR